MVPAQCFKPEDRERLLGIVEAAFGDFSAFNAKVRSIFKKRSATMDKLPAPVGTSGAADKDKDATELFAVTV